MVERALPAYIAVCPQIHCKPSSYLLVRSVGVQGIVISVSVCMSVCQQAYLKNYV